MWKYLITPWCKGHLLHYTLDLQNHSRFAEETADFYKALSQCTLVFRELTSQQNLAWKRRDAGKKQLSGPCKHKLALSPPKGSKDIPKILRGWEASCQPSQKSISPVLCSYQQIPHEQFWEPLLQWNFLPSGYSTSRTCLMFTEMYLSPLGLPKKAAVKRPEEGM